MSVVPQKEWRTLWPFFTLAAVAAGAIFLGRTSSFRFDDGSFSLHAPFWITWPRGVARVLWPWGFLALPLVRKDALMPLAWIGLALIPYSFLTYSTQIPSRQTYLASAGLALLFGMAIARLNQPKLAAAAVALAIAINVGYLWTKKRAQFLGRAEPTEQLIRFARTNSAPIWIRCFPRNSYIALEAVHVGAGRPESDVVWNAAEAAEKKAAEFCYRE